ncbi:hypothetical protein [Dyadobacter psychrophilus]|uniref:Uncharacterized protein n=1 Tax=Dyadobacter psychrophilus TaxID=651661 RepID=A0A1T5GZZ0_9BACT|nr:hypothetical protein [Dyadobacter psychrophilus]SKC14033.1 hypothetical protein SAMN05660293_04709 [Dyadobacter psychrophilus]
MPHPNTLPFYEAYVTNVRDFLQAGIDIKRTINRSLKTGKTATVTIQTKLYALTYSTYSEASFMKMILTPYGFDQIYVEQILKQSSIQEKWLKCLEIAFINFSKFSKGSEIPNRKLALRRIIKSYIVDPSIIRNKIAHGQFTVALNSANTSINPTLTTQLADLNIVTIYRWFEINKRLCGIIEDLIESPDKAHYNQYYTKYQDLEKFISDTKHWTVQTKMQTAGLVKPVKIKFS